MKMRILSDETIYELAADLALHKTIEGNEVVGLYEIGEAHYLEILDKKTTPFPRAKLLTKKKLPKEVASNPKLTTVAVIGEVVMWLKNRNRNLKANASRDKQELSETNRRAAQKRWEKARNNK